MNTKNLKTLNSEIVPNDSFSSLVGLSDAVKRSKLAFFKRVQSLPHPQSDRVFQHYNARLKRANKCPMLGEYAPFMLCDVLRVSHNKVEEMGVSWLMLYEAALLADDLADNDLTDVPRGVYLLQLMLTEAILEWRFICDRFPFLWNELLRFQRQAVSAAHAELDNIPCNLVGNADENFLHGRKNALAKFCASTLSALERCRPLDSVENRGIDSLCCGVQLLDDITDIRMDITLSQSNYSTNQLRSWLLRLWNAESLNIRVLRQDELVILLLISGVLTQLLDSTISYFEEGIKLLQVFQKTITGNFFFSRINSCKRLSEQCKSIYEEHSESLRAMCEVLAETPSSFTKMLNLPGANVLCDKMQIIYRQIPKASN